MSNEGMIELEYHLATITVIINSSKNHKWMLKLMGKNLVRNGTYTHHLKVPPHKIHINPKSVWRRSLADALSIKGIKSPSSVRGQIEASCYLPGCSGQDTPPFP